MFEQRVDRVYAIFASHVDDEAPVAGLRAAVFDSCRMQASDRGVWEAASAGGRESHREIVPVRLRPMTRRLVRRANATGRLRVKFDANDLPVLLWTGGALHASASPTTWWRYVQLRFDSFLADDDPARQPMVHKAPSVEQIDTAMRSFRPA